MYKNPNQIINDKIVIGITNDNQIQPNAIDFSVDKLFEINNTPFYLSNDKSKRVMRNLSPVQLSDSQSVGHIFSDLNPKTIETRTPGWLLTPNGRYEGTSDMYVEVPEKMAAFLVIKSTLNRNSVYIISGLYDSGFKGNIGFTLHNPIGYTFVEQGSLIGQIVFVDSESVGTYAGGYNTTDGQHWTELKNDVTPVLEIEEALVTTVDEPDVPIVNEVELPVVKIKSKLSK